MGLGRMKKTWWAQIRVLWLLWSMARVNSMNQTRRLFFISHYTVSRRIILWQLSRKIHSRCFKTGSFSFKTQEKKFEEFKCLILDRTPTKSCKLWYLASLIRSSWTIHLFRQMTQPSSIKLSATFISVITMSSIKIFSTAGDIIFLRIGRI